MSYENCRGTTKNKNHLLKIGTLEDSTNKKKRKESMPILHLPWLFGKHSVFKLCCFGATSPWGKRNATASGRQTWLGGKGQTYSSAFSRSFSCLKVIPTRSAPSQTQDLSSFGTMLACSVRPGKSFSPQFS